MKEYSWIIVKTIKSTSILFLPILFFSILIGVLQPLELLLIQNITKQVSDTSLFRFRYLVLLIFLYGALYLVKALEPSINKIINELIQNRISKHFYGELFKKISKTNLTNFNKEEFNTKIVRAQQVVNNIAYNCLNSLTTFLAGILGLISVSIIVVKNAGIIYLILFLVISILQNIYIINFTKENIRLMSFIDHKSRRHTYLFQLFYNRESAREIRSHKIGAWLEEKRDSQYEEISHAALLFSRKWSVINSIWSVLMFSCEALIVILLILQSQKGTLSIDQFVVVISSYEMFIVSITGLIDTMSNIAENIPYLKDYMDILRTPSSSVCAIRSADFPVRLDNVSFSYQHYKKALDHINLTIDKGQIIALVGHNGSGKTTLSQVMLQLLAPSEGTIKSNIVFPSAVFQDFAKYAFTLRENIIIGDLTSDYCWDDKYILETMRKSQCIDLATDLPMGVETFLGREFETEGTDLSLGQWQKVAIARSIFKNADFIVFDEPTASLDPLAEKKQFDYISQFLKGKTVVLVSHRIGLCKLADKIVYLKDGKIAEIGSHSELMDLKNEYYNFHQSQAKWYIE